MGLGYVCAGALTFWRDLFYGLGAEGMNPRQRYIEILTFGNPDRIPFCSRRAGEDSFYARRATESFQSDVAHGGLGRQFTDGRMPQWTLIKETIINPAFGTMP